MTIADKDAGDESESAPRSFAALRVHQWLPEWDDLVYESERKPKSHFYLFSMSASKLRSLSDIYRRSTSEGTPRKDDQHIQRRHDPARSSEIARYVRGGYPWSDLSEAKRNNPDNDSLKKPGWLPTAVVVNILTPGDRRDGRVFSEQDVIQVLDSPGSDLSQLIIPPVLDESSGDYLPPLEVIDGQHRLFAFDDDVAAGEDYALPVVAFHGLDISWQAYLFWTINIKPKKINPSLAFDLYPLLREQDWLDGGDAVHVYRESRAQELTEALWASPSSPWFRRINMLGGARKENGPVTQAAFIRSLVASMVKSWRPSKLPGGIFGGTPDSNEGLSWSRLQQAAFLLTAWQIMAEKVQSSTAEWAELLREQATAAQLDAVQGEADDAAWAGANSLLATDQGVRGFQYIVNDFCYLRHQDLHLANWEDDTGFVDVDVHSVASVSETLRAQPVFGFLVDLCTELATFDWRSSGAEGLTDTQRQVKAALRGSGGYKELRVRLVSHLRSSGVNEIARTANDLDL